MKIHFGHCVGKYAPVTELSRIFVIVWKNMAPGTELPLFFSTGIGPLQFGVVVVVFKFCLLANGFGDVLPYKTYSIQILLPDTYIK